MVNGGTEESELPNHMILEAHAGIHRIRSQYINMEGFLELPMNYHVSLILGQ